MIYPKLNPNCKYILKKTPDGSYCICSPSYWYLGQRIVDPLVCGGNLHYCKAVLEANGISDYQFKDLSEN